MELLFYILSIQNIDSVVEVANPDLAVVRQSLSPEPVLCPFENRLVVSDGRRGSRARSDALFFARSLDSIELVIASTDVYSAILRHGRRHDSRFRLEPPYLVARFRVYGI